MTRTSAPGYLKHLGIAALALCMVAVAGCTSETDEGSRNSAEPGEKPRVALVMKSLANEFFVTMAAAAERHQEDHAHEYELIVNGIKNESDLAQQVALVDQMIALGVDAMVIAPTDSKALVPALARARARGIHVVNIDNRLDRDVLAEFRLGCSLYWPGQSQGRPEWRHGRPGKIPRRGERYRARRRHQRPQRH